ncbi:conserved Plasmodium protein, unknown function [Plasmodium chabaudi chabaudi]|uniref:Uncharacterized protein n=1 Tax=Plasmodium chabaudi chabaudi TaxID=31271 RepID=A0A4V0K5Q8_PLACU|nr:conserved Plasmodium protein, unknown function [Plasmodium chabaudi chabaudi]VTZ67803.1 conserved Plasmodium protein, unknown function [Plasmodium chabaudi chabaudi]|eukprot:XP_738719.2 conserved Plasmodium protein, unknown function [Plasmodium chabaudi chabaudi]
MENNRMVEKKKKNINVVDRFFKKHFSSIYIIRLILNLVLLNILVIYFVIHFFFNQSTQNRMNSSENFNNLYFFKIVQKNEETYENVIYVISIIYVILSLAFFILEFYIKWRKNNELKYVMGIEDNQMSGTKQKENENKISNKNSTHILPDQNSYYEHTLKNSKTINTSQLKDLNKKKNAHTNIYITTNYIFVYTLLILLGIRQYNITEYVLYFYFILAICELITPLTISMKLINLVTKYYKINFLKKEKKNNNNNSNIMIKRRDIYFFFCYFAILRFLKKTKIYDKIMIKKSKPVHEPNLKTENNQIEIKNKNVFSKYFAILKQNIKKKNNYIFYHYFVIFSFLKNCIIHILHILRGWMYSHIKTKEKNKNMNEAGLPRNIENVNTDLDKREINYNDNLKKNINISNTVVNHFNAPNESTKSEKKNGIHNKNKITKKSLAIEKSVIKKDDLKLKALDSSDKITSHLSMKKRELNKIIKNTNKYKDYYIKYNKYNKTASDMEEEELEFEDEEYFVNKNVSMIEKRQFKVIENNSNDMNKCEEKKINVNPNQLELKHIYEHNKDNSLYFSNTSSTEVDEKETTEADHNKENISYKDKNGVSTKFYNNYMANRCNSNEDIPYSYNNKYINKEGGDKNYFSKTEFDHAPSLNINKRNTICTYGLTYKIKKNDVDKKNISFEKNIKIILSNFKRRMEVCIFLNAIYKIALLLNILIIFFVMSIMLHINLYIFTINLKPFFFYKIISILIQCCYFVFFHLHVYEYNTMIK